MMKWKTVAALLAGYGFLKEIRPSEPYIVPFLTGPDKNFTAEQVNQEIFPVSTYSMFGLLVVIFLVTDFLRYKPIIVLQSVSALVTYSLVAWGQGVPVMQFMEVLYGLMWAADVAYFTYMYAKVDRVHYGMVSATARVGYLLGRCSSGVLSQVTVSLNILRLLDLQYITIAASSAAVIFAIFLPPVTSSFYFRRRLSSARAVTSGEEDAEGRVDRTSGPTPEPRHSCKTVAQLLWRDSVEAFRQPTVVRWSIWWAVATGGYMMITNYVQIIWQSTITENGSNETLWNGGIEAAYTILGTGAVWLTTRFKNYTKLGGVVVLAVWSLFAGAIIMWAGDSRSMVVQYLVYIAFGVSYHAVITIVSAEVAKRVHEDAHALVFGVNQLGAFLLQTLLTFAVAGEGGFELDIRQQFLVYGIYFLVMGGFFSIFAAFLLISTCLHKIKAST